MGARLHVRRNDRVVVISGDDAQKRGKVLRVNRQKRKLYVEGVNYVKKHMRASRQHPRGGIIELEAPIDSSNVMLICPNCDKPTRVMRMKDDAERDRLRVCKKCKQRINPTKDSK